MSSTYLVADGSVYIGAILGSILYGVYLGLVFTNTRMMIMNNAHLGTTHFTKTFYLLFEGLSLITGIVTFFYPTWLGQLILVNRTTAVVTAAGPCALAVLNTTSIVPFLLGDTLLIYRCYMIFGLRLWIIVFPSLCLASYTTCQIVSSTRIIIPAGIEHVATCLLIFINPMSIPYAQLRRRYVTVYAMLIESATPWTVIGIILLGRSWIRMDAEFTLWTDCLVFIWRIIGLLSPQLIIFRVAMGLAWDKNTMHELSQLETLDIASAPSTVEIDTQDVEGAY